MPRDPRRESTEHDVVEHAHRAEHDYARSFEQPDVEKLDHDEEALPTRAGPVSHREKHAAEDFAARRPAPARARRATKGARRGDEGAARGR